MIPKSLFEKMHKKDNIFREDLQLGEDLDMGNKLKHYGKIEVIDSLNKTFARRYIDYGYIRIMFEYAKAYFNSLFGTRMKTFYPEHKK
jgi:hypothetical protein